MKKVLFAVLSLMLIALSALPALSAESDIGNSIYGSYRDYDGGGTLVKMM